MSQHNDLFLFAIPGFVLLTIAELIFLVKEHHSEGQLKDIPVSLTIGIGFIVISFSSRAMLLLIYQWAYIHRIYTLPSNAWYTWLICFVADDFSYYWFHRLSHQIRILWASHSVHHTAETYSLATAGCRQTWTGNFSGTFLFWIWMPFIGFEPGMIILVKSISLIYQFCLHTETIRKMPFWYEAIFNTPSHHRVHHGSDLIYLDKNYGASMIIWDRLFGTFQTEEITPIYGLTYKMHSSSPFIIVFHEWIKLFRDIKRSRCLSDYCNYFFNVPGWSKDGSTKTTRQLRAMTAKDD